MDRPGPDEFATFYSGYVSQVQADLHDVLRRQAGDLRKLFEAVDEAKGSYSYAEGKWTIKEVLSHVIDGERIFAYRILRISRGDHTPIEGFEQDDYIATSNANSRCFADLIGEFELQRRANVLMIKNISDESSRLMGTASGKPVSVRALCYILAGHAEHHLNILRERYLA
jgi:hypothetical protein